MERINPARVVAESLLELRGMAGDAISSLWQTQTLVTDFYLAFQSFNIHQLAQKKYPEPYEYFFRLHTTLEMTRDHIHCAIDLEKFLPRAKAFEIAQGLQCYPENTEMLLIKVRQGIERGSLDGSFTGDPPIGDVKERDGVSTRGVKMDGNAYFTVYAFTKLTDASGRRKFQELLSLLDDAPHKNLVLHYLEELEAQKSDPSPLYFNVPPDILFFCAKCLRLIAQKTSEKNSDELKKSWDPTLTGHPSFERYLARLPYIGDPANAISMSQLAKAFGDADIPAPHIKQEGKTYFLEWS